MCEFLGGARWGPYHGGLISRRPYPALVKVGLAGLEDIHYGEDLNWRGPYWEGLKIEPLGRLRYTGINSDIRRNQRYILVI